MRTLAKTFAAAALIAVSTFTMAASKPEVSNPKKAVVNLSTADLAIDHYVAGITEGQSTGAEQLLTIDFKNNVHASEKNTKNITRKTEEHTLRNMYAILSRNNNGQTLDIQTSKNCL